eukprot:6457985-Alexandrium_andersonii.AAC.1
MSAPEAMSRGSAVARSGKCSMTGPSTLPAVEARHPLRRAGGASGAEAFPSGCPDGPDACAPSA